MFDKNDIVIYVGKAKNLRNRLSQYFKSSNQKFVQNSIKVSAMVKNISRFEYIVLNSEVNALILENNLIKKYDPKYNIRLKDDKTYPYAKITINEQYPRVFVTRNRKEDKAKYFGPYTDATALNETIELIHKLFPIRTCNLKFPRDFKKSRPCLNYHINKCNAPCNRKIAKEEYDSMIDKIIDFFNGKFSGILEDLKNKMNLYSENLEYEKALEIRDKITRINNLIKNQSNEVENVQSEDRDIIAFARVNCEAVFQLFFIRNGKLIGREHFMLNDVEQFERSELMEIFVKQFYGGTPYIPKNISLEEEIQDKNNIELWLSSIKGQKVFITIPKKGEKLKLVQMAHENAMIMLDKFGEQIKREQARTIGAVSEIQEALGIEYYLKRIEAYDISNTQGVQSVGSMVVFEDGKPLRTDYRKFKIKTVFGSNDYASMEEIIRRRFGRYKLEVGKNEMHQSKFDKLPNAIFIDGGLGHVNIVKKVLDELNIDIIVCGMVKDDFHKTRGLIFNDCEIGLKKTSEGFKLITRIQDEAHRFAIEYHRKAREKSVIKSVLDDIEGVGDKRKKALLRHFGSIDNIRRAEVSELSEVESMNIKVSQNVYSFFRK